MLNLYSYFPLHLINIVSLRFLSRERMFFSETKYFSTEFERVHDRNVTISQVIIISRDFLEFSAGWISTYIVYFSWSSLSTRFTGWSNRLCKKKQHTSTECLPIVTDRNHNRFQCGDAVDTQLGSEKAFLAKKGPKMPTLIACKGRIESAAELSIAEQMFGSCIGN